MTVKEYLESGEPQFTTEKYELSGMEHLIVTNKLGDVFVKACNTVLWELFPSGACVEALHNYIFEASPKERKAICLLTLGYITEK
jgi:hypothetical protein